MSNSDIKFLFLDVDGTLTDGKIYIGEHGEIMKVFNAKDGLAIHDLLIPAGIKPVIITGRTSTIVENRCKELGITELYQGVNDKLSKMREILSVAGVALSYAAYIGDDLNDLDCMKEIKSGGGIIACPYDAAKEVKEICDFVSTKNGGDGVVREFVEVYIFPTILPAFLKLTNCTPPTLPSFSPE